MSDKNFLGKAKTNIFRAAQKISEKVGRSDETIDLTFNQDKDRFELHYKNVKRINETTIKVLSGLRELAVQQAIVIQDFHEIYDPSCPLYPASAKAQEIAKKLDQARNDFDEHMRVYYVELLSKYQGQFAEMNERISERNLRRLDMDRYAGHLKRAMEKGDREKEASNKAKLEAAKQNYKNLNEELLRDLPLLYEDRVKFFGPLMANYYSALSKMVKDSHQITRSIIPDVANIDRTTQHEHPRVTTDPGFSSATHKSSGTSYEDPNQQQQNSGPNSNRLSMNYGPPPTSNQFSGNYGAPPQQNYSQPPTQPSRPVPSAPPMETRLRVKAIFDFNAQDPSELPFRAGDIITILKQDGEWWEGEMNGRRGLLPNNYVQAI